MFEIAEFRAWKKWVSQRGRCQATTKAGHPCKKFCAGMGSDICGYEDFNRVVFVWGVTDRCRVHCRVPTRTEKK